MQGDNSNLNIEMEAGDSDDEIMMSGFKDKSLNRINIMTVNDSFKKSDSSFSSQDTMSKITIRSSKSSKSSSEINGVSSLESTQKEQDLDKENINVNLKRPPRNYDTQEQIQKLNDVSDYSSISKSNFMSRDDSNSFLALSDDMITIEDTYKETEDNIADKLKAKLAAKQQNGNFLPNNYLVNQTEEHRITQYVDNQMNIIEEEPDEEDKSCASSMRRSNNISGYNSNDPYGTNNSGVSRGNRNRARESFETFGQKSLTGMINTLKSDSKDSRNNDASYDSESINNSIKFDQLPIAFKHKISDPKIIELKRKKEEEEKADPTVEITRRNIDPDISTDISAQITKRTIHTKSNCSMPSTNLDNVSKFRAESKLSKETDEDTDSQIENTTLQNQKSSVHEYIQFVNKQFDTESYRTGKQSKESGVRAENNTIYDMVEKVRICKNNSII